MPHCGHARLVCLRRPVAWGAAAWTLWAMAAAPPKSSVAADGDITFAVTAGSAEFLQSCGCGGSPSLGLAQRAALLRRLRGRYPRLIALDAGHLGDVGWRAAAVLEALSLMGYAAVAVQPADGALVRTLGWPRPGERMQAVRETDPIRWVVSGAAAPRVAVIGGAWWREALAELARSGQRGAPPRLLVCLGLPAGGHDSFVEGARAAVGSACGILIAGAHEGHPPALPADVAWVAIAPGGATVWVVGATPQGSRAWGWRTQEHRVTADLEADPQVRAAIDRYYLEQQEAFMAAQRDSPGAQRGEGDGVRVGTEIGYVPAFGCRNCHAEAFAKWQHSRHARAVQTLAEKQRLVPECLACHSEEFRRTGRLRPTVLPAAGGEGATDPLDGSIECASCHGDGITHAALGTKGDPGHRKPVRCTGCHDAERSPRFNAAAYLARIRHGSRREEAHRP